MPQDILLPPPPLLAQLASETALAVFLDFDGTLVDIALRPDAIDVPAGLQRSLSELGARLDGRLALVSGRAISDIEHYTGPLGLARAGSHGADIRDAAGRALGDLPAAIPADVLAELEVFATAHGFLIEQKPHGAALHYREDPSLGGIGFDFAAKLAKAQGLDIKRGKCVIEVVGKGANKGSAVAILMSEPPFAGARPVFVGDDVTDEDGFRAVIELGGCGIIVGDRKSTSARYRLASPAAVHHWLGL